MFRNNILLSNYSNYKIGGPARYFCEPKSQEEIIEAVREARQKNLPIFILGGGTNLLISDAGFDGLVIKPKLTEIKLENVNIKAGSGVLMKDLLNFAIDNSLSGLEWAGGLPGTLGGAIRGNAGAFKGEIKDAIQEVESLDISGREPRPTRRSYDECGFGYRASVFKENNGKEIILQAILKMKPGDKEEIKRATQEKIDYRNSRHPMDYPNIGSIFKNIDLRKLTEAQAEKFKPIIKTDPFPVVPTAFIISEAGFKGRKHGQAMISEKHPNFIVNLGGATCEDVKFLISLVKKTVKEKFDIKLEEEVIYL